MKTYRIPNTDLDVSRLAFGTWHMGGTWDKTPPTDDLYERAGSLLDAAVDNGINHIDLADIYTFGKSDLVVGDALSKRPGMRDKLVLQEKVGIVIGGNPDFGPPGRYDFSTDHIVREVEGSLKRLNTDYVDILALHRPDPLFEPEEVAAAFDQLQSSGKVRYFGVSNHNWAQIDHLQKYIDQKLVVNQVELNIMHHYLISDGVTANMVNTTPYAGAMGTLDYCRMNDIMIQAWSPVAGGSIFNPSDDAPENVKAVAALLVDLAAEKNTTASAIAFAWLLRHPAGIQPIVGSLNPKRIPEAVPADDVEMSRQEWYRLLEAARGAGVP
ncbi:MAG: aldo/keto reductase [Chloroflexota bacterium]